MSDETKGTYSSNSKIFNFFSIILCFCKNLTHAEQSNNCKKPLVLIKEQESGTLCMALNGRMIRFVTCNSLDDLQQWEVVKTVGDRNNIRICIRSYPEVPVHDCLTAFSLINPNLYKMFTQDFTIKPSNEARDLRIGSYSQSDQSQHWLMNSTTHQLSNVQYPKACITTRHFKDPAIALVLECNGYGYESPNPKLSKHQSFYLMPALDKNGKQQCSH